MSIGRKILYTDVPEITYDNVLDVVRRVIADHELNAARIDYLLRYEAGDQPLARIKVIQPYIDVKCTDNVANEITEFNVGFKWSQSINLVQRGEKDSGTEDESLAISLLNEQYECENIRAKTQKLGRFVEVGAIGYTYVSVNNDIEKENENGESYFKIEALDPRTTFVIRSSYYIDQRIMLSVTYRKDVYGNRYFTCFSKDRRFEIINLQEIINGTTIQQEETWKHDKRSGEENPLHLIPIVEWFRSFDRLGCFERQIDDMDCLNLIESDICNASESAVQAIWHCNDVEFPEEEITLEDGTKKTVTKKPQNNDWLQTFTSQDGKTPFVTPLKSVFDYEGNLNYAITKRALILQKCNVPTRNDNSGGSTGIAMDSATGWNAAETAAASQQNIMESCKMEEVKIVLRAIKISPFIPQDSPLLKLKPSDVQPSIKRSKNYEMSVKTSALANMLSHGIYGLHALKTINLFDDVSQVWTDSKELIEKYQNSIFDKENQTSDSPETTDGGREAQISNSPLIDGMSNEKPINAEKI